MIVIRTGSSVTVSIGIQEGVVINLSILLGGIAYPELVVRAVGSVGHLHNQLVVAIVVEDRRYCILVVFIGILIGSEFQHAIGDGDRVDLVGSDKRPAVERSVAGLELGGIRQFVGAAQGDEAVHFAPLAGIIVAADGAHHIEVLGGGVQGGDYELVGLEGTGSVCGFTIGPVLHLVAFGLAIFAGLDNNRGVFGADFDHLDRRGSRAGGRHSLGGEGGNGAPLGVDVGIAYALHLELVGGLGLEVLEWESVLVGGQFDPVASGSGFAIDTEVVNHKEIFV